MCYVPQIKVVTGMNNYYNNQHCYENTSQKYKTTNRNITIQLPANTL